jgi:hypothetical protein
MLIGKIYTKTTTKPLKAKIQPLKHILILKTDKKNKPTFAGRFIFYS